jgi:hypothetical protein
MSYKVGLNIMRSTFNCKMEHNDSGEECTMCVQTAEQYVESPNDVDIEMTISTLKMEKQLDMIKSRQD